MRTITLIAAVCLLMFSCVPATKFKALEEQQKLTSRERDELKKQTEKLNVDNTEYKTKQTKLEATNAQLVADSVKRFNELTATQDEVKRYKDMTAEMQENQLKTLKGKELETSKLMTQLQSIREELKQ